MQEYIPSVIIRELRRRPHVPFRLLLIILPLPLTASRAQAATFTVDTTTEDAALTACNDFTPNDCSLRGAILVANALSEASIIHVPAGTYFSGANEL
jgi:hypothetical protein